MDSDNESQQKKTLFFYFFVNAHVYARFELNFFNKKFNTKVAFEVVPKKKINMLFAVVGRSVLRKTVPLVLSTALGLRPRAVLKTSGTVFPNTDLLDSK